MKRRSEPAEPASASLLPKHLKYMTIIEQFDWLDQQQVTLDEYAEHAKRFVEYEAYAHDLFRRGMHDPIRAICYHIREAQSLAKRELRNQNAGEIRSVLEHVVTALAETNRRVSDVVRLPPVVWCQNPQTPLVEIVFAQRLRAKGMQPWQIAKHATPRDKDDTHRRRFKRVLRHLQINIRKEQLVQST